MDDINDAYPGVPLRRIPKQPGMTIVKNTRTSAVGHDLFRVIEKPPTCNVSAIDERPFLRFNVAVMGQGGGLHRIIGFAHPDLIRILSYPKITLFIDGTFKMVPKGFSQCVIVMAFDPATDMYVPIYYVLADNKEQTTYWRILNEIIIDTKFKLDPAYVTGKLDVLTLVPEDEILDKGVRFVRSMINETGKKRKWDQFWLYFERTWIQRFDPSIWNVHAMAASDIPLVNRTNNPLERSQSTAF
ncbi:hypothetical protein P43SY_000153 [Pythium insidiosum]|uniref:MULE transposase domain-containing protein n=1 Tax=Pythium insidiosum TaxID=114742 RepID=A0AAD5M9D5_PYTIN|nr:hypothetical protein P43SY_000153 [Pythium insidiosum]